LLFGPPGKGRILQESELFMKNICSLPLLFLGLCLSAFAGAQDSAKLLVSTDMDCNWKLDGQPMDPLKAGDSKVIPVSPGEHLIQAATTDGVATMRTTFNTTIPTKMDVLLDKFWVSIQLKMQHDRQLKMQQAKTDREPAEAEVPIPPTWTDPATGLMWTRKDNGSDVDWNQADAYCSNLQLAGYKDWRLPTIEELQGIFDPSVSVQKVFEMGTFKVHVKGNLNLTGWHWSSSQGDTPGKPFQVAWHLNFGGKGEPGNGFPLGFSYDMRALCVRHSGE
jgi:hypothetical protein